MLSLLLSVRKTRTHHPRLKWMADLGSRIVASESLSAVCVVVVALIVGTGARHVHAQQKRQQRTAPTTTMGFEKECLGLRWWATATQLRTATVARDGALHR
jgi:hypothetical protein